jgi:hypothetical protein
MEAMAEIGPHRTIREAVHGLRALGTVFISFDLLLSLPLLLRGSSARSTIVAGTGAIVLLAPGAIYHVAAVLIGRRELRSAQLSQRTASVQCVLIVAGAVLGLLLEHRLLRKPAFFGFVLAAPECAPSIVGLFFLPALLAQIWHLRSAIAAILALPEERRGFEAIPMARRATGGEATGAADPIPPPVPPAAASANCRRPNPEPAPHASATANTSSASRP